MAVGRRTVQLEGESKICRYTHISVKISYVFYLQVDGPLVLQLQKARNVCVPKTLEDSAVNSSGHQLLRLTLTDGLQTVCALEMDGQTSIGYCSLMFSSILLK